MISSQIENKFKKTISFLPNRQADHDFPAIKQTNAIKVEMITAFFHQQPKHTHMYWFKLNETAAAFI
jgi:hypothetical protein